MDKCGDEEASEILCKAIRSNVGDAKSMQDAVMAMCYHSSSTDSNPQHFLCPPGLTSWCKFKRCEATGQTPPPHHTTIHPEIAPFVKAEFEKLSGPALIERELSVRSRTRMSRSTARPGIGAQRLN